MEIFIIIFPALSFLLFQFLKEKIRIRILYGINILLYLFTFFLSVYIFLKILNLDNDLPLIFYPLIEFDEHFLNWSLRFDLFVSGLIVLITFMGFLLFIFSINQFQNHLINIKINSYLSLSIFSVLVLLSSNNLIQFFIGWYLIILSSYLISNISENKKVILDNSNIFIQNRASDLCFFLSLYFIYTLSNSINFDVIFKSVQVFENNRTLFNKTFNDIDIAAFILFFSFILRCRQFYISNSMYDFLNLNVSSFTLIIFGVYLPAGIYFVLRFLPFSQINLEYFNILIILGFVFTLIFLFLLIRSYNLKNLISYFAASQFGVLLITIGFKLYGAVAFYFFTLTISLLILCLGFGIITSKLNYEQDIRKMGHLIIKCPSMFLFILIGFISFLGIPYFSGFYSNQLLFSQLLLINEENYFLILICYFINTFIISYISFKILLIVFLGENNCNIHLYNKIVEASLHLKIILVFLSVCLIFSGWYLNNLFSGNVGENLWRLVVTGNTNLSINNNLNVNQSLFEIRQIICYFGIFFAFLNFAVFPKLGNNIKLKNNKLFKYYLKTFTSYNFNK